MEGLLPAMAASSGPSEIGPPGALTSLQCSSSSLQQTEPVPDDSTILHLMGDDKDELKMALPLRTAVFHDLPSLPKHHIHFELRIVDPSRRES